VAPRRDFRACGCRLHQPIQFLKSIAAHKLFLLVMQFFLERVPRSRARRANGRAPLIQNRLVPPVMLNLLPPNAAAFQIHQVDHQPVFRLPIVQQFLHSNPCDALFRSRMQVVILVAKPSNICTSSSASNPRGATPGRTFFSARNALMHVFTRDPGYPCSQRGPARILVNIRKNLHKNRLRPGAFFTHSPR